MSGLVSSTAASKSSPSLQENGAKKRHPSLPKSAKQVVSATCFFLCRYTGESLLSDRVLAKNETARNGCFADFSKASLLGTQQKGAIFPLNESRPTGAIIPPPHPQPPLRAGNILGLPQTEGESRLATASNNEDDPVHCSSLQFDLIQRCSVPLRGSSTGFRPRCIEGRLSSSWFFYCHFSAPLMMESYRL